MTPLDLTEDELLENFELLEDWSERYRYIIELGRKLPPLDASAIQSKHLVRGCQSQVWMTAELSTESPPILILHADSDAHIVKGLIAIVMTLFANKTPQQILRIDVAPIFEKLGLGQHLSPSRTNGLHAMVKRVKELALGYVS